jgi:mediator of RNA polymerase II transcription subunit 7
MADQQQQDPTKVLSTFPDPPPFWQDFTQANLERVDQLRRDHATQTGVDASAILRFPNIPEDLINLQPPAEPVDGKWRLYGEELRVRGWKLLGPSCRPR